jgi:predicted glycosyltransferase involved in capsule biosynthesis
VTLNTTTVTPDMLNSFNISGCLILQYLGALTKEQFTKINGFSNNFFGWGGEDETLLI